MFSVRDGQEDDYSYPLSNDTEFFFSASSDTSTEEDPGHVGIDNTSGASSGDFSMHHEQQEWPSMLGGEAAFADFGACTDMSWVTNPPLEPRQLQATSQPAKRARAATTTTHSRDRSMSVSRIGPGHSAAQEAAAAAAAATTAAAVAVAQHGSYRLHWKQSKNLPFHRALQLLTDEHAVTSGERPGRIHGRDVQGVIFKEKKKNGQRRAGGNDIWTVKGGKHGFSTWKDPVTGVTVKRSYGKVKCRPAGKGGGQGQSYTFHQYLLVPSADSARAASDGCDSGGENASSRPKKDNDRVTVYHVPITTPQPLITTPDIVATNVVKEEREENDDAGALHEGTEQGTVTLTCGILQLQKSDPQHPWLQFLAPNGAQRGEITETRDDGRSNGGVVLRSTAGDFAEWHRRAEAEQPFVEGDVVGIASNGLTRRTKGMPQVGVVSRRAVVEGSVPALEQREFYDRVAYTGHVSVKLRGPVQNGDVIVPS